MEMAWLLVSCLSSIMAWRGARHVHDEAVMGEMRCREDGAGAFEEGGGFRLVVAGADVGEVELFRPGIAGEARGLVGGAVAMPCGAFFFAAGKGGFMHDEVGVAAEVGVRVVVAGVAEDDDAALGGCGRAVVGAVQYATVAEGNGFAFFQAAVERPGGNAFGAQAGDVQRAGLHAFLNAVGVARHAVVERVRADAVLSVFVYHAGFADFVDVQRVRQVAGGGFQHGVEVAADASRAVEVDGRVAAHHAAAGEQAGQAEDVVAMQVGDEDAADAPGADRRVQDGVLCRFAAVKEPGLRRRLVEV